VPKKWPFLKFGYFRTSFLGHISAISGYLKKAEKRGLKWVEKSTFQKWAEIWSSEKTDEKCKNGLFKPFLAKIYRY
jgi:hypothetical protein